MSRSEGVRRRRAQWEKEFREQTAVKHFGQFVAMKRRAARAKMQAVELQRLMLIEAGMKALAKNKEAARALEELETNNPITTVYT